MWSVFYLIKSKCPFEMFWHSFVALGYLVTKLLHLMCFLNKTDFLQLSIKFFTLELISEVVT